MVQDLSRDHYHLSMQHKLLILKRIGSFLKIFSYGAQARSYSSRGNLFFELTLHFWR